MMNNSKNPNWLLNSDASPEVQLNLNVRGLSPSATIVINDLSNKMIREGRKIFKMGLGQSPFPVPGFIVEELKHNAYQKDYLPGQGLPELRQAIADHHCRTFDIECHEDDVLVGPGSKELMFILQLVYYGDILIPTPAWVSYAPQAQIIGRHINFLPTRFENEWKITPEQLDQFCRSDPGRPRILILNYPSNPTGMTYNSEELEELAGIAKKYRLILLSDEIYGKLNHENKHTSIVPFYPEGSIFSGGLSKWCGAGGWRLGLFVFPKSLRWLLDAMTVVVSETSTSTSAPIQYAAVSAFQENDAIVNYLHYVKQILRALGKKLTDILIENRVEVHYPQGGFYLFPNFSFYSEMLKSRGIITNIEFCERLLKDTGVAILPGKDFGQPLEELTARIAYVNFNGKQALEAITNIKSVQSINDQFLFTYCREPLEAIKHICDWLKAL